MYSGQQTPSLYEVRIASDSFIEQFGRERQLLPGMDWVRCVGEEFLGAQVKVGTHQDLLCALFRLPPFQSGKFSA